jgi:predicted NAD/FAD-dependent oxidoreductase
MENTTVIIGAGMAGLIAARALHEAGARVLVLEKSRGVGGRLATKRVGEAVFDHGAQYFTVKDEAFAPWVNRWQKSGAVAAWPGSAHRRFIGRPSMTAVAKELSEGIEVKRDHKVSKLTKVGERWCVEVENHGLICAARVILTAPVPQSLALLAAGGIALPAAVAAGLARLNYSPCLALLVTLNGPSRLPVDGVTKTEGDVRWVADNKCKGVSPRVAAVTLHLSPEFSSRNYGLGEAEVLELVRQEAEEVIGESIATATLHRWKFAHALETYPERCVWLPEHRLGFAGDAFGGPRVEGAALSGLAMAERVRAELKP